MTNKPPLFSIITITRNNSTGLNKTYASILSQSCKEHEWIIADGASSDDTLEFLSKNGLANHCVSEPDQGIYDAMNKGIGRSRGDYLIFLNAGDQLSDPDILSVVQRIIAIDHPDFIYGDALEYGGRYKKANHDIESGMLTHHQAMFYKRNRVNDRRYSLSYKIAADYDFTIGFLKNAHTVHYCPAAFCLYEPGGISQQNARVGRREENIIRKRHDVVLLKRMKVSMRQTVACGLKKIAPSLYWKLR